MDPVIPLVITLALAILWLVAGTQKLRAFGEFSAVLADYRLVPDKTTDLCAAAVIALELGHGIALLLPVVRHVALIGSAALLILYAAAMAANLVRGRRFIDCGCMGPAERLAGVAESAARIGGIGWNSSDTGAGPGPARCLLDRGRSGCCDPALRCDKPPDRQRA